MHNPYPLTRTSAQRMTAGVSRLSILHRKDNTGNKPSGQPVSTVKIPHSKTLRSKNSKEAKPIILITIFFLFLPLARDRVISERCRDAFYRAICCVLAFEACYVSEDQSGLKSHSLFYFFYFFFLHFAYCSAFDGSSSHLR